MIALRPGWLLRVGCAVVGCVLACGCGGGREGRHAVARVHGKVTYNGQPVDGATVTFYPDKPGVPVAAGTTDASGSYRLTTYEDSDGAAIGTHKVAIRKRATVDAGQVKAPPDAGQALIDELQEASAEQGKPLLPERYFAPESSKLTAEVAEGKKNEINFDLKD